MTKLELYIIYGAALYVCGWFLAFGFLMYSVFDKAINVGKKKDEKRNRKRH